MRIRGGGTALRSVGSVVSNSINTLWRAYPYAAAGLTCGVKASAADWIAQRRQASQEGQERATKNSGVNGASKQVGTRKWDFQRNLAYVIYGAVYQGIAQEFIYNRLYPILFGSGTGIKTVLSKVMFDLLVQTTLFTLPIAYLTKALIYRFSFKEAFEQYGNDVRHHGLLVKYFMLWGPIQCLTFSIIPVHFRITFVAMASFFWLIILSTITSRSSGKK